MSNQPEFTFEGHKGEKFAFVSTENNLFYNSELLFIEYDDIIKAATKIDYYKGNLNEKKLEKVLESCLPYWDSRMRFESTYDGDKVLIYSDPKSRETVRNCVEALNSNSTVQNLLDTYIMLSSVPFRGSNIDSPA